jgi:hypothetical protein
MLGFCGSCGNQKFEIVSNLENRFFYDYFYLLSLKRFNVFVKFFRDYHYQLISHGAYFRNKLGLCQGITIYWQSIRNILTIYSGIKTYTTVYFIRAYTVVYRMYQARTPEAKELITTIAVKEL